jgi:hypothetical protein
MQYITPKTSFALKCNDISLSDTIGDYPVTNNTGTINTIRTAMTWYSVDLKEILGSMYDKYDLFNLRLRYIQYNSQAGFGGNSTERSIYFQMSGLNFYNSTYDTGRGCNVGNTTIGSLVYAQNTATKLSFDDASIITIRKQQSADISITYISFNNAPPTSGAGTQFPRTSFYFDLTPLYTDIPKTIELSTTKCSSLFTQYLGNTTRVNQIDMYAVLGRENFELGAKYNLVFKSVSADINANYVQDMVGFMFLVSSSGMRFQNYETALGKVGGNKMQMVTYNSFQYATGTTTASTVIRNQTSGIMTFTLEAQICDMTIQVQNTETNTENTVDVGDSIILFDIWKCIEY